MTETRHALQPGFLAGAQGRVFTLVVAPRGPRSSLGVLFIPPFAEEMNRSRRMFALQAQAFANAGVTALILDLFGTGDSQGDFQDADVHAWIKDLELGMAALLDRGCSEIAIVALRFGALLAGELVKSRAQSVQGLVLWQPVPSGSSFMTQFLRLRLASDLTAGSERMRVADLTAQLASGDTVDVAGYSVSPQLYDQIQGLELQHGVGGVIDRPITLMDINTRDGNNPSPGIRSLQSRLAPYYGPVTAVKVSGEPFWQTPEITLAPDLIPVTVQTVLEMDRAG